MRRNAVSKYAFAVLLLFGCSILSLEAGLFRRDAGIPSLSDLSHMYAEARETLRSEREMAMNRNDDDACHDEDFEKLEEMLRYVSDDRNQLKKTWKQLSCGRKKEATTVFDSVFGETLGKKLEQSETSDGFHQSFGPDTLRMTFGELLELIGKIKDFINSNVSEEVISGEREECYIDYSAFVEPITNLIQNGIVQLICDHLKDKFEILFQDCGVDPRLPEREMPAWGRRMIDAMSKIPTSISDGRLSWVGAYDYCHNIEVGYINNYTDGSARSFTGKYCRLDLAILNETGFELPIPPLQFGICVPDTCNSGDVAWYISNNNTVLRGVQLLLGLKLTYVYCGMEELDSSSDSALQAALAITIICLVVVVIATIYDGFFRKRLMKKHVEEVKEYIEESVIGKDIDRKSLLDEKPLKIRMTNRLEMLFVGFSAYTNFRKVFTIRDKPGDLPVLSGIRALSYFYVMWGNTYVFGPIYFEAWVTANIVGAVPRLTQRFLFQPIVNFHLAEDSFLLISGILVTYWFLRRHEENDNKLTVRSVIYYFLHRYWRLMPVMMLSIMIFTCTYKYTADGPLFPPKDTDGENCRVNWWVDLLMVHNIVKTSAQCFGHAWFVPLVFQLHVAAIVVVIPLVLFPVVGYVMIGAMYVAHIGATAAISTDLRQNRMEDWYNEYLLTPWCRAGPFVIGLAFGVILHKRRELGIGIHWALNLLLWIVALVCVMTPAFASYGQYQDGGERWSTDALIAYDTLARSSWALGLAWIALACHFNRGGVIESFLCWKAWTPISRLVYTTLLMHGLFIFQWVYTNRQPIYIDEYHQMYAFFGHLVYVMIVGLTISLIWDLPFGTGFEKAIIAKTKFHWIRAGRHPRRDLNRSERKFFGLDDGSSSSSSSSAESEKETGFVKAVPNSNDYEDGKNDGENLPYEQVVERRPDSGQYEYVTGVPGHSNDAYVNDPDTPEADYSVAL